MKKIIYIGLLLLTAVACTTPAVFSDKPNKASTKEEKANKIKNMIDEQAYTFMAQTALPMSMPVKHLTGDNYDLRLTSDSIIAFLPYYGRAYVAPMNNNDIGIKFTSTDFDYKIVKESRKGWDININVKDKASHSYNLSLFISKSGSATLQVSDNNRQPISFNGYIKIKE